MKNKKILRHYSLFVGPFLVLLVLASLTYASNLAYAEDNKEQTVGSMPLVADQEKIDSLINEAKSLTQNKTVENFEKAIKIYEEALKLDPNNLEALWRSE